jgi:hypothetical protein
VATIRHTRKQDLRFFESGRTDLPEKCFAVATRRTRTAVNRNSGGRVLHLLQTNSGAFNPTSLPPVSGTGLALTVEKVLVSGATAQQESEVLMNPEFGSILDS